MKDSFDNNDYLYNISNIAEDFFNTRLAKGFWALGTKVPAVNIETSKDRYRINLAVPGMKKEDFEIEGENRTLRVSCEKESTHQEKEKNYTKKEFNYHSFKRVFSLPDSVDINKIQASYKSGILAIEIPNKDKKDSASAKKVHVN